MKKFLQKNSLLVVVFLTGASVLVVEVLAVRILSPYFGNTIFSVSSVLGVILAALSIGYYFGGKLADKYPEEKWFYFIIMLSGFLVLILGVAQQYILPFFGAALSIVTGPFISSLFLFFIPALFLGTLSPYVITLQQKKLPNQGIGSIAGSVFFWSTFGSITGSLATGFLLVPFFGVHQIITGTGTVLVLLGLIPLLFKKKTKKHVGAILVLVILLVLQSFGPLINVPGQIVYAKDGVYERLAIYEGEYKGRPARFFMQDRSHSGAMYLDGEELVYEYTKYYQLAHLLEKNPQEMLVLGGGIYTVPKAMLNDFPDSNVDVVEIEPSLYDLAKTYFNLPEDDRLTNYVTDGRRFLQDSEKKYDVIFSDVYDSLYSIPTHFTTKDFFSLVSEKLDDEGLFIGNFIGSLSRKGKSFIFSELNTMKEIFPNIYVFATDSKTSVEPQNLMIVGYKSDKPLKFDIENTSSTILGSLKEKQVNLSRYNFEKYPIFTDNYSPVDYVVASVLQDLFYIDDKKLLPEEALGIIKQQLDYGPRCLGVKGHKDVQNFISSELNVFLDKVIIQEVPIDNASSTLKNIIGQYKPEKSKRIILGTHYDTKKFANNDIKNKKEFVPGANDGASGVAVLLEFVRYLKQSNLDLNFGIDFVFFDGEEGNNIENETEWKPIGSNYFAKNIKEIYPNELPSEAIILDLVCEKEAKFFPEKGSVKNAHENVQNFWKIGQEKFPKYFLDDIRSEIHDDHTALNNIGIPSFLVIDLDYKYFHTTEDTLDKCSLKSLDVVLQTLSQYIENK